MCSPVLKHKLRLVFIFLSSWQSYVYAYNACVERLSRKKLNKSLLVADREGKWSLIPEAMNAGADIIARNRNDWTPLMLAIDNHHWYEVKKPVEHGADVLAAAKDGTTVTMLGEVFGRSELIPLMPEAIDAREWRIRSRFQIRYFL